MGARACRPRFAREDPHERLYGSAGNIVHRAAPVAGHRCSTIGSHLLETLLNLGQQVVGLDNFATGHVHNLAEVRAAVGEEAWARFRLIEGDIRDFAIARRPLPVWTTCCTRRRWVRCLARWSSRASIMM